MRFWIAYGLLVLLTLFILIILLKIIKNWNLFDYLITKENKYKFSKKIFFTDNLKSEIENVIKNSKIIEIIGSFEIATFIIVLGFVISILLLVIKIVNYRSTIISAYTNKFVTINWKLLIKDADKKLKENKKVKS